jgi:hypothetical protein
VLTDDDVVSDLHQVVDLNPSWIQVRPKRARSIVVFAPISTSLSIWTMPICGTFLCPPTATSKPKPSEPITVPL